MINTPSTQDTTGTSLKCQPYCTQWHTNHAVTRALNFLRQSDSFTVKFQTPWRFTQTQFCPATLTHSEAPTSIVHPSLPRNLTWPLWHWSNETFSKVWNKMLAVRDTAPHQLPFQRFHALFHSLFKVLFIFPSRYLFAIGLVSIFSFRWSIPPTLGCTLKQPDSMKGYHNWWIYTNNQWTGLSPSSAAYS